MRIAALLAGLCVAWVACADAQDVPPPAAQAPALEAELDRAFADYVRTGGFPEAVRLSVNGNNFANEYLQTVFKNIYENDISKRHTIYGEESYQEVVNFLVDSIGSSVSAGNISKVLTANKKKIDIDFITRY